MLDSITEFIRSAITEQIVEDPVWATVALIGQLVFGGRFVLQWIASEYKKRSHVPTAFWYISLIGSLTLLTYSIHIKNHYCPVISRIITIGYETGYFHFAKHFS